MELVAALTDRQAKAGEPDKLFARRLGLSRQAWQKIRTRECGLGSRSLAGIVRAYPELTPEVHIYLSTTANSLTDDGDPTTVANGAHSASGEAQQAGTPEPDHPAITRPETARSAKAGA